MTDFAVSRLNDIVSHIRRRFSRKKFGKSGELKNIRGRPNSPPKMLRLNTVYKIQ